VLPALVLAAGLATRLRPLSLVRAKAALPVAGVPLVRRVLDWLVSQHITDIVINLHHLPHTITRVVGDGSDAGARVRYSWEDPVLGSAGGPRHALPLLGSDRFVIVNGDTLTNVEVTAMIEAHERSGALVTMALIPNPRPERYGGVLVDGARVTGYTRRGGPTPNFHFVGVQIADRAAFERLADGVPTESVGGLYPELMRERDGSVGAFISDATFDDIGTPVDYFEASQRIGAKEGGGAVQAGRGCSIHPAAQVTRSILWDGVVIGEGARLSDCIVTDGTRVPPETSLDRHVIVGTGDNLQVTPF
jgi:NDP-sugar pyrophosphorylase family protein